jgi:CrcB protein
MNYIIVFVGAGLGGAFRHGINVLAARVAGTDFPYGTLFINVLGSFLMGIIVEYLGLRLELSQSVRLFLTTGILGGFTTFSAFSLEAALLYERAQLLAAIVYVVASVVLAIGGLFAGLALVRAIASP